MPMRWSHVQAIQGVTEKYTPLAQHQHHFVDEENGVIHHDYEKMEIAGSKLVWRPVTCHLQLINDNILDLMKGKSFVFMGDSTVEELAYVALKWMGIPENEVAYSPFDAHENHRGHTREFKIEKFSVSISMIWNGGTSHNVDMMGLRTFQHLHENPFAAKLRYFLNSSGNAETCNTTIFLNSGFHDIVQDDFTYEGYQRDVEFVIEHFAQHYNVIWLATSPNLFRHECFQESTHGYRLLNEAAARAVQRVAEKLKKSPNKLPCVRLPEMVRIDLPRVAAFYEGDGRHCLYHYWIGSPKNFYEKLDFGVSCVWRGAMLWEYMSKLMQGSV